MKLPSLSQIDGGVTIKENVDKLSSSIVLDEKWKIYVDENGDLVASYDNKLAGTICKNRKKFN